MVAGKFKWMAGRHCPYLTRLNPDGSPDLDFAPSIDNEINCVLVQPDGKILLGGKFTNLAGRVHGYIGQLRPDGTDDTNFSAYADGPVTQIAVQTDDKIVVAGSFYNLNGVARRYLGRLSADGATDISFNPQLDSSVANLALQADGGILLDLGYDLRRLNSDGTLDSAFVTPVRAKLTAMAVQADGKIVLGGDRSSGNAWTIPGRIFSNGAVDGSFCPSAGTRAELVLQADGKVLIGTPGYWWQGSITRWTNTDPAIDVLAHDQSSITWSRGGTAPEIWAAKFAVCTNGTDWMDLGMAQRIAGGWQMAGLVLPASCAVIARGFVTVSGSTWFVENAIGMPQQDNVIIQTGGSDFGIHSRRFTFRFSGSSRTQVVESSTNLLNWTALGTNAAANGPLYFSDPAFEENSQRFYRIRGDQLSK